MKRFRIEIDPRAVEDIESAVDWLSGQAPEKVPEWLDALEETINTLQTMPERCPKAPENGLWETDIELRQLLFDRYPSIYRIIFTVADGIVRVLQVRHGARRWMHDEG